MRAGHFAIQAGAGALLLAIGFVAGRSSALRKAGPDAEVGTAGGGKISALVDHPEGQGTSFERRLSGMGTAEIGALAAAGDLNQEKAIALFREWAKRDPVAALVGVEQLDSRWRTAAAQAVAEVWVEADLDAAVEWAKRAPESSGFHAVVDKMAAVAPPLAAEVYELQSPVMKFKLAGSLAARMAESDLAFAAQWIEGEPSPQLRLVMSKWVLGEIGIADPKQAGRIFDSLPAGTERRELIRIAAKSWVAADAAAAGEWLAGLPPSSERDGALGDALYSLSRSDIVAAAAVVVRLADSTAARRAAGTVGHRMAQSDPLAALEWAGDLTSDRARDSAAAAAMGHWLRVDFDSASAHALALPPDDPSRDAVLGRVAGALAERDPEEQDQLFQGMGVAVRSRLLSSAANTASDPVRGAELLERRLAAGPIDDAEMSGVASSIAGRWRQIDAGAAAEWLEGLPPGEARDRAIYQTAYGAITDDPLLASRLVRQLPKGADRDSVAARLAVAIARQDGASAFDWGLSIASVELREESLISVVRVWSEENRGAAVAAVQAAPLESPQRDKLLQVAERR